ncbi:hypothetical protein B0J13DRAFT_307861 [Dactylonectria estremocensis]|uniref:Secreted protein n=1 Tax=Dactylonectria estremocensis TaxID=1079267 RepID=A0A9P9J4F1_9HYPO|nr:hypothetical protein B0J13DRAFT_307861 [Dactylonectria estremocensis]
MPRIAKPTVSWLGLVCLASFNTEAHSYPQHYSDMNCASLFCTRQSRIPTISTFIKQSPRPTAPMTASRPLTEKKRGLHRQSETFTSYYVVSTCSTVHVIPVIVDRFDAIVQRSVIRARPETTQCPTHGFNTPEHRIQATDHRHQETYQSYSQCGSLP